MPKPSPAEHPAADEAAAQRVGSDAVVRWETAFSLATNRFVLYDMLKVIGITWAVMLAIFGTIFAVSNGLESAGAFMKVLAGIMTGFLLLFMGVMLVFFGNRYPARFTLSRRGALVESLSGRAHAANRVAIVLGALAGRPGTAGAGLLAASSQSVSIAWRDVRRVREHSDQRVISLMNGWRVVVRLYCTPENFATARSFVHSHARDAA